MIILIGAVILGIVALIWLWKVPIRKMAVSMQENGSSAFEAYTIILLLAAGTAFAIYMITKVV